MADRAISDLTRVTSVGATDLFVLQQNGTAKSLTGQVLENWLLEFADGHGGIQSITKTGSTGTNPVVDTYRILLTDETYTDIKVTNGVKGDTGAAAYVHIKWASQNPTSDSQLSDLPDDWIGIYSGTASTAPKTYSSYTWFEYKGDKGDTGDSITAVEKTSGTGAGGTSDTYTVYAGTSKKAVGTFTVRNGMDGSGSVVTVNSQSPDTAGNVTVTGTDIELTSGGATIASEMEKKQPLTDSLAAETSSFANEDTIPFYDASAGANRKIAWSNVKVDGSKITDSTVTMAKLSDNAKYGHELAILGANTLSPSWGYGLVWAYGTSCTISLSSGIAANFAPEWKCRIYAVDAPVTFSWSGISGLRSSGEAVIKSSSGSISIPQNRYLDIMRIDSDIWLLFGNYADRLITSGTADPSGGSDGDIYLKYSE
jgi:hypothetical protein